MRFLIFFLLESAIIFRLTGVSCLQEKEVLQKVRSKPLHLTQIEEKAIEELKRFS
jgi:hypothetical protein